MGDLHTPVNSIILLVVPILLLGMLAVMIVPYWKIFKKAGFPGPLGLLMIVPLVNVVVLYVVAFSPWKTVPEQGIYPTPYPTQQPPSA